MFLTDIQGAPEIITKYKFFYFLLDIDEASLINFLLFSIIIFFIIKNIILFLYFYFFNKFNASLNYEISKKIFLNIMNNNYEYYLNQKKSKIIHAITEESKRFSGVFFSILNLIKDGFLILFLATSIFLINWKISIIMFLMFLFFSLIIFIIIKKKLYILGKNIAFLSSNFLKSLFENFSNIKFIKIRNLETFISSKIFSLQKKILNTSFLQNIIVLIPRLILEIFAVTSLCLTIYIYINSSISIDKLISILSFVALSVIRMVPAVSTINVNINNITTNKYSLEIVYKYLSNNFLKSLTYVQNNEIKSKIKITSLKFEKVYFKYQKKDSPFEIKNLNIDLKQGDILGVIGQSGGGKTTFADLVLGLLKPDSGKIFVNGKNLENLDYNVFDVSYIPQTVNLIDDTLYKNISFNQNIEDINLEKMKKVISSADLDDLQLAYKDKKIGEDGIEISGGQKQRIGIARAFYNNPSLLVLDEPTSELDYESEKKIISNLKKQKIDIVILIAHRLNTLNFCNKLIIFKNGNVEDFGSKDAILNKHKELSKFFHESN